MSWFRDLVIRLGGGTPEPPEPFVKRQWTPPGYKSLPDDFIAAATRNAEELQRQIDREAQRLRDRERARSQHNPFHGVPSYMGWDVTPKDSEGALPLIFDIHRNRIPDEQVVGWGGEEYRRVLTYADKKDGHHRYTVVDETEFIRWKNRQPS